MADIDNFLRSDDESDIILDVGNNDNDYNNMINPEISPKILPEILPFGMTGFNGDLFGEDDDFYLEDLNLFKTKIMELCELIGRKPTNENKQRE